MRIQSGSRGMGPLGAVLPGTYTATVDGFSPFVVGVPADAVRGDDPTEAPRLTEVAGLSPATQSPDRPVPRPGPSRGCSGPASGGIALLSVLFLARRRVPYGSSLTGRREEGTSAPGGVSDDRTPGGPDDD